MSRTPTRAAKPSLSRPAARRYGARSAPTRGCAAEAAPPRSARRPRPPLGRSVRAPPGGGAAARAGGGGVRRRCGERDGRPRGAAAGGEKRRGRWLARPFLGQAVPRRCLCSRAAAEANGEAALSGLLFGEETAAEGSGAAGEQCPSLLRLRCPSSSSRSRLRSFCFPRPLRWQETSRRDGLRPGLCCAGLRRAPATP